MINTTVTVTVEDMNSISNFFEQYDSEIKTVSPEEVQEETCVSKYISSLVCGQYQKSVEDIENTKVGNTLKRKRNLQHSSHKYYVRR